MSRCICIYEFIYIGINTCIIYIANLGFEGSDAAGRLAASRIRFRQFAARAVHLICELEFSV